MSRESLKELAAARVGHNATLLSTLTLRRYFEEVDRSKLGRDFWAIVLPLTTSDAHHEKLLHLLRSERLGYFPIGVDLGFMDGLKKDREESYWGAFLPSVWSSELDTLQKNLIHAPLYGEYDNLDEAFWISEAPNVWKSAWAHFRYFPLSVPEGLLMQTLLKEVREELSQET